MLQPNETPTFKPKITATGKAFQHRPLQERSNQVLEEKRRRLERVSAVVHSDRSRNETFTPKINKNKTFRSEEESRLRQFFDRHSEDGEMRYPELHLALCSMGLFKSLSGRSATEETDKKRLTDRIWQAMQPTHHSVLITAFVRVMTALLAQSKNNAKKVREEEMEMEMERRRNMLPQSPPSPIPRPSPMVPAPEPAPVQTEQKKKILIRHTKRSLSSQASSQKRSSSVQSNSTNTSQNRALSWKEFEERRRSDAEKAKQRKSQMSTAAKARQVEGCTFQPTINNYAPPCNVPSRTLDKPPIIPSKEKDQAECTFHPQVHSVPQGIYQDPVPQAPGFSRAVERMEKGRRTGVKRFEDNLRSGRTRSSTPGGKTEVRPFSFQTDKRERNKPLLYVDVNLGAKVGRIGVHNGDKVDVLAANFATTYGLDKKMKAKLEGILQEQLDRALSEKKEEKKPSTPTTTRKQPRNPLPRMRKESSLLPPATATATATHPPIIEDTRLPKTPAGISDDFPTPPAQASWRMAPPKEPVQHYIPDVPEWGGSVGGYTSMPKEGEEEAFIGFGAGVDLLKSLDEASEDNSFGLVPDASALGKMFDGDGDGDGHSPASSLPFPPSASPEPIHEHQVSPLPLVDFDRVLHPTSLSPLRGRGVPSDEPFDSPSPAIHNLLDRVRSSTSKDFTDWMPARQQVQAF